MASPQYKVVSLDLAVARTNQRVEQMDAGVQYDGVTVQQLPGGAIASLAFGDNKQLIPLTFTGQPFRFIDECGNPFKADEGLFITNPAGAGTLILLISLGTIAAG